MAVKQLADNYYTGLNSDTKPLLNIRAGALFEETNTGDLYQWDGDWKYKRNIMSVSNAKVYEGNISIPVSNAGIPQYIPDIPLPNPARRVYLVEVINPSTEASFDVYLYIKDRPTMGPKSSIELAGAISRFSAKKSPDNLSPTADKTAVTPNLVYGLELGQGLGVTFVPDANITAATQLTIIIREVEG